MDTIGATILPTASAFSIEPGKVALIPPPLLCTKASARVTAMSASDRDAMHMSSCFPQQEQVEGFAWPECWQRTRTHRPGRTGMHRCRRQPPPVDCTAKIDVKLGTDRRRCGVAASVIVKSVLSALIRHGRSCKGCRRQVSAHPQRHGREGDPHLKGESAACRRILPRSGGKEEAKRFSRSVRWCARGVRMAVGDFVGGCFPHRTENHVEMQRLAGHGVVHVHIDRAHAHLVH